MFPSQPLAPVANARQHIVEALESFLRTTCVRRLYVAELGVAPPELAYVTAFTRISVPLEGEHPMEIVCDGAPRMVHPVLGDLVLVPANAWNKPEWGAPVTVLTLLLSAKQIGASLVRYRGDGNPPVATLKTSVHDAYDGITQQILRVLMSTVRHRSHEHGISHPEENTLERSLPCLLSESLLHACLQRLSAPAIDVPRKAVRTYEAICLYVQDQYQQPLTREAVARQFGLAPTHVSRLFRNEGLTRFSDYLNLVRVQRAKFLLKTYGMPLKEIASRCGYTDVAYFCHVFKHISGVTPTQYRDNL